ncbi:MAG: TetR/AcrR family transcriptional regulator [Propionibacteriaceae bacterium]|jgi:AcrR family transcriptional regulator|nr:TetR/AcrR family transcriptional regulator [Propionibacteriaceae bacterium]
MAANYHHGDLRRALIENGIQLINAEGAQQLSLRRLARICGVSQAAPYSYFAGKAELLAAMQEHVTGQLMDALTAGLDAAPDGEPAQLIALGKAYVMFFIQNAHYYPFLFSWPTMTIDLAEDADGSRNFPPYELLRQTALAVLGGRVRPEHMQDAIIALWSTVHGLAGIATMKHVHYGKDWESTLEGILRSQG